MYESSNLLHSRSNCTFLFHFAGKRSYYACNKLLQSILDSACFRLQKLEHRTRIENTNN